jgi:uncharacterized integral membrane protein
MEFMTKVKLGIAAAIGVVVLIVVFQNWEKVLVKFLFVDITMPLVVTLLITLAIGFGLGWLTSTIVRIRKAKKQGV